MAARLLPPTSARRSDLGLDQHADRAVFGGHRAGPENIPRLRLKPKARMTGHVDGAWWPRGDDLASELPDLLAVLSVRLGSVERVMYNVSEWAKVTAPLTPGGRSVRLDGFSRQPANTLEVLGVGRERLPSAGGASEHRSGHRTRRDDDRSGAGQRFDGRRHARDQRRRPSTAGRVLPTDISPMRPEVWRMTVTVTLPDDGTDKYMRFGDVYVEHNDGALDVYRGGAKQTHSYASGEWTDVEGDQKRFKRRGCWG
jgi:hypothetical protein